MKLFMPTLVYCERDCVKNHGAEIKKYGSKVMIVTGRHSSRVNGSLKDLEEVFAANELPYVIFDEIEENPSVETCARAAEIAVKEGVDVFVGVGGGSPMDASKAISYLTKNPEKISDARQFLYDGTAAEAYPVICVPTTSGTGSEVTQYAVLTIHETHEKVGITHHLFPVIALADSKYLATSSYNGMASCCIDALAHLVESYLNTNSNDYNRMYVREGLKAFGKVKEVLRTKENYENIKDEDRDEFMHASLMAGMAIAHTGTSLPHALSYKLTYEMGIPHGKACGIFLPGFMEQFGCQKDVEDILALLGFASLGEFEQYIFDSVGHVELEADFWKTNVEKIYGNPAKLKNYPYELTFEAVDSYYRG